MLEGRLTGGGVSGKLRVLSEEDSSEPPVVAVVVVLVAVVVVVELPLLSSPSVLSLGAEVDSEEEEGDVSVERGVVNNIERGSRVTVT